MKRGAWALLLRAMWLSGSPKSLVLHTLRAMSSVHRSELLSSRRKESPLVACSGGGGRGGGVESNTPSGPEGRVRVGDNGWSGRRA